MRVTSLINTKTRALATAIGICLIAVVLVVARPTSADIKQLNDTQKMAIDGLVKKAMEDAQLPSAVVLIDKGGNTIYESAFGVADLQHEISATVITAYGIGSITKSFTALAIVQLAYDGQIDLSEPLTTYLPDYKGPAAVVTVRQLLNHTSGIPNYTGEIPGIRESLKRTPFTREQMVEFFEHLPLHFEPGSKFSYTNSGYYLLGLIIEEVTGESYYDYLQSNIFDPLDMSHTFSGDDAQIIADRARGYGVTKTGYVNAPPWWYLVPFSAGSLVSTAEDLVKYRRGVFHSEYFSDELREMLLEAVPFPSGELNIYSVGGLIVSDFEGYRKISHGGDIWGYTSAHAYYPDDDVTIVMLTNRQADTPSLTSIERKIARVVLEVVEPEILDLELSEADLQRYTGDYRLDPYLIGMDKFGFIGNQGKLYIRFGGTDAEGSMIPLLAQGDGVFRAIFDDDWVFKFVTSPNEQDSSAVKSEYRDGTISAYREN